MMLRRELDKMANRFVYAWEGLRDTYLSEISFKVWVVVNCVSGMLVFLFNLTGGERALIIALGFLILAAECMNTAIEHTIDLVMPEHHELAKKAKDAASTGVALTAVAGLLAWIIVLF